MTGGEAHEVKGYDALMELHDINPDRLLGDKGYDSDDIRYDLAERGIEPVIPPRSNRKTPIEYDREAYKRRNLIERCVNRLKQFRRIATRYEKTARAYLSMLCLAAARLWIKTVNTALAQELMVRHRSNQAERTPFFRSRIASMTSPAMPVGNVGHNGAAGELFVKGGWGRAPGDTA